MAADISPAKETIDSFRNDDYEKRYERKAGIFMKRWKDAWRRKAWRPCRGQLRSFSSIGHEQPAALRLFVLMFQKTLPALIFGR